MSCAGVPFLCLVINCNILRVECRRLFPDCLQNMKPEGDMVTFCVHEQIYQRSFDVLSFEFCAHTFVQDS